jgi:hypothetical protein
MPNSAQISMPNNSQNDTVTLEIILRDFLVDILRPLVTPYCRSIANAPSLSI